MRRALLASSMLITIGLPLPGQAITIADYIDMRDNADDAAAEAQLNDYLGGVLDGLVMLGALSQGSDAARFCMPDENVVELDVLAFRRELDAMLEQLEDEVAGFAELARTRTLGLAAVQLLAVQHPCGD